MRRRHDDSGYHFYGYDAGDDDDASLEARFFAFQARRSRDDKANTDTAPLLPSSELLDAARDQIERGPGGDVDAEGQVTRRGIAWTPAHLSTIHAWQRLYERVQAGTLGGLQDGGTAEAEDAG